MKKSIRSLKKLIVLVLVLALSVESLAAVVDSDDGAAFITKAEFENLKSNFAGQVKNYENSLSDKIDGAIASYLTGVKIANKLKKNLLFNDWETVTCLNYKFTETYRPVEFYGILEHHRWLVNGSTKQTAFIYAQVKGDRGSTTNKQTVNVVNAGSERSATVDKVTWLGYSYDYQDKVNVTLSQSYNNTSASTTDSNWINSFTAINLYLANCAKIAAIGQGADMNGMANYIWQPRIYKYITSGSGTSGYFGSSVVNAKTASAEVTLAKNSDNKSLLYPHIIHYSSLTGIKVCDPDWTSTLVASGNVTGTNWTLNTTGTSGSWSGTLTNGSSKAITSLSAYYKGDYSSSTESTNMPTVGLLNGSFTSGSIMQFDDEVKLTNNTEVDKIEEVPILAGFCLLDANMEETIEWEPKFINIKRGSTATYTEAVKIQLSKVPFTSSSTADENLISVSVDGGTTLVKTATTKTDGTCKLKWEMPYSGVVYMKWWPANSTTAGGNWSIDLDVENCSTYTLTEVG